MGKKLEIHATKLAQKYTVFVSLPDDYDATLKKKHPVLYVLDGNMHFDATAAMTHYLNGAMPQMIVVGIQQNNRNSELIPYINPAFQKPGEQRADDFLDFFEIDLIPYIAKNYATESFSILSGHSLGGLFTLYAMIKKPKLFSAYFSFSPAVWEGNYQIISDLKTHLEQNKQEQFLYTNIEEIKVNDWRLKHKTGFEKLNQLLHSTKATHLNWQASIEKNEDHMTVAIIGFYKAMRSLFSDWFLDPNQLSNNKHNLENHYLNLSKRYGYEIKALETDLYGLTHFYINKYDLNTALHIAQYRLINYPKSHTAMRTLADVYHAQKKQTSALLYINKAIKLAKNEAHNNLESYRERLKKFSL